MQCGNKKFIYQTLIILNFQEENREGEGERETKGEGKMERASREGGEEEGKKRGKRDYRPGKMCTHTYNYHKISQ